jgi:ABC-type sugar transport system ATPase subunit
VKPLVLQNIYKHFDRVEVLRDVSLGFEPGTVTAIVGDNGAGKSTLLKIVAGILAPSAGNISFDENAVTALSANARRSLGIEMVYQDLALASQQDVVTNLFMGREQIGPFGLLKREAMRTRAQNKLNELGIEIKNISQRVSLLSGGQQQAVAIARALLFDPQVLLLDEPTAALAVREVERVLEIIRRQRAASRIVILVSHRLNDVFAVADRIVVLKHGQVAADNLTAQVTLSQVVEKIVS